jgi:hypothetical protein
VTPPFNPAGFVDRKDEQGVFNELLTFEHGARLMTIRDRSGTGKSHLLKLLRFKCQYAMPAVPVGLVPIDELADKSPYAFAAAVERALSQPPFNLRFTAFRQAEERRIDRRLGPLVAATANAGENRGEVVGLKLEAGATFNLTVGDYAPDVLERLRDAAVEGFLDDLRRIAAERPVVILIDAYEHSGGALEAWLQGFLQGHVIDPDSRPDRLVVVVAGQSVPTEALQYMLGARLPEFARALDALSPWERDHVREFLDSKVVPYDDDDVDYLCAKLAKGWTIRRADDAVREILREGAG